jgi:hypothetical protein
MQEWICIHECFQFSTHLFIGDVIQSEENPGHHFTKHDLLSLRFAKR